MCSSDLFQQSTIIEDRLRTNLADKDKISLFERQVNNYKLLTLVQHRQGKFADSLISSERGRARAFQELIAKKKNFAQPTIPTFPQIQALAKQNKSTIIEYSIIPRFGRKDPRDRDEILIYVITPDGKLTVRAQKIPKSLNLTKLITTNRENILNSVKSDSLKQLHQLLIVLERR